MRIITLGRVELEDLSLGAATGGQVHAETSAGPLSRLLFSWLTPLVCIGVKRPLEPEDVWPIPKQCVPGAGGLWGVPCRAVLCSIVPCRTV